MLGRYACVLGLVSLSIGCSDSSPPNSGSTGGASGSAGAAAGATSTGGGGGSSAGGHPSAGAGSATGGSGGAMTGGGGTVGGAAGGGNGGAAQAGTQNEAGSGGDGPLPDEFEVATKQKGPTGIALDAEAVYWANRDAGTIVKCPLNGCGGKAPTVIASNIGKPMGIAIGGDTLYWMAPPVDTSSKVAQVLKCPLSGCTGVPEKLFQFTVENRAVGVHVSGDTVYYAAWPQLGSCAAAGCDDKPTAFTRMPALGVDRNADSLFVARNTGIISCSLDGCKDEKALTTDVNSLSLALDATHVYFTSYDYLNVDSTIVPGILRCPLAGCGADKPETIKGGDIAPFDVAVNDTRLFYTDTDAGTVVSMAKPQ